MKIEDDLKEIQHLNTEKLDDRPKRKWPFIVASVCMAVMLVTWIFVQYPLGTIIAGQLRSGKIENNMLDTLGVQILFDQQVLDTMYSTWFVNLNQESVLCIHGIRRDNTYSLTYAYQPEIYDQSFKHVRHEPCDSSSIMMFHTHPYKSCLASSTDLNTLERRQEQNPDMLMMVMCENDRFTLYS
jgi:proteasome lid subunit RPN8/RPN11